MKGLKALQDLIDTLEDEHLGLSKNEWVVKRKQTIENELKALEILKPCCIVADYKCENPEDRYELAFCKKICITEEEYNLLKEVLL